jgi:hypothetical protein
MTDTIETGRRPCRCGKGEVVNYLETPDHGWASGQWRHEYSRIDCPQCDAKYLLSGEGFVLRSDWESRDREQREVRGKELELLKSPPVAAVFERLAKRLDEQPSMAAAHRLLSHHGLTHESLNTFRKNWSGGGEWVRRRGDSYLLGRLREIGAIDKEKHREIVAEMDRLKALQDAANRELPLV